MKWFMGRSNSAVDGRGDSSSMRADLEEVLAGGYHGLRGLLLVLAGIQLVERHRRRGLSAAEVAAASLATLQVGGELLSRRRDPLPAGPVLLATTLSGWLIHWLGRDRSDERLALRGWEVEWTNWNPLFARLIDDERGPGWSVLSAVPHLGVLARSKQGEARRDAVAGIILLGAADVFGRAFGTALRARADLIDARAGEFVAARSEGEEERVAAGWREQVVGNSTATLRRIRAGLTAPGEAGSQDAPLVQAEYETLRRHMVEAGNADAAIGDWEVGRAAQVDRDVQELARDTRRALGSLNRYIGLGSASMVALGIGSSPPARRAWVAALPVAAHLALLSRPSRVRHLRGDRSTTGLVNFDLAVLAVAYHVADIVTSVEGERHGAWASTCVASLAMPAAASAATSGGAMLPAAGMGAARLTSRVLWGRDGTNWVEVLSASIYFGWMTWALFRAIDAIWAAEARLERWTAESGRHAARVAIESNRRKVQLALHDHGVQTLRYLARHDNLPVEQRTAVLDRAIAELSSVVRPGEQRRGRPDLGSALSECVDGYRRFGLDPTLETTLGPTNGVLDGRLLDDWVIHDAVNQGLSNVLAHSSDRRPSVRVTADRRQLLVAVANTTKSVPAAPTLGFGLGQLDGRVRGCGGTLRLDTQAGVTTLTVMLPLTSQEG